MSGFPCEYCGKPIEGCGIKQRFHLECRKARHKEQQRSERLRMAQERKEEQIKSSYAAQTKLADERTIIARQLGTTYGKLLAAPVEVKQRGSTYTYKQIKALADRNGISYQAQARAMGL